MIDRPPPFDPKEDRRAAGALIWVPIGIVVVTIVVLVLVF